jgi:hypothetical protein
MFTAIAGRERLSEFLVLQVDELDQKDFSVSRATIKQKMQMVSVEVCRKEDFGKDDLPTFLLNTHLGTHLKYFDTVMGYDLENMALASLDKYQAEHTKGKKHMPDVVLVKKAYPKLRKRGAMRYWKVDRLKMEAIDENNRWAEKKKKGKDTA